MNSITIGAFAQNDQPQTMGTREIAEITNKEHRHVLRDTEAMFAGLEISGEGYAQNWTHPQNGQTYREFQLPKDLTLTLIAGYNVKLRKAIIDRWAELETAIRAQMIALPQDYASALRALADESEKSQALQARIEHDAPKVAFADQVEAAPDAITLAQAAKILGTGRNRLAAKLRELGWITRLGEPYQDKINAGLMDVKIGSWDHPEKGLQRSVTPLITGKGLAKLHKIFATKEAA